MRRILFAAIAATMLVGGTGCGIIDTVLVGPGCGICDDGVAIHEPQLLQERGMIAESGCCDSGDCDSCCPPCPLIGLLSSLNPCNWNCDRPCADGGCGLFGGPLFGGPLFGGWGCGERYYGDFWGSGCDSCDQHGNWTGPNDPYYPRQSEPPSPVVPAYPPTAAAPIETPPSRPAPALPEAPPAVIDNNDVKPMPGVDDITPDAVEGDQAQGNTKPGVFRQIKSTPTDQSVWRSRRSI